MLFIKNERQYKACYGVSQTQFMRILQGYCCAFDETQEATHLQRALDYKKYGMTARLKQKSDGDLENELHLVLFYLKNYPTYDVLGATWGISRSAAESAVRKAYDLLLEGLNILGMLPKRYFEEVEEMAAYFQDKGDLLVDVTERNVERPGDYATQKAKYSGKKKRHTVKNTIITNEQRRILYLGITVAGSMHDFKMFKTEFPPKKNWFKSLKIWVDLGYQGIVKLFNQAQINIPFKKKKKQCLSEDQKAVNRELAGHRIIVEHVIGHLKIFRILVHRWRNKRYFFDDQTILAIAGIHNLKQSI